LGHTSRNRLFAGGIEALHVLVLLAEMKCADCSKTSGSRIIRSRLPFLRAARRVVLFHWRYWPRSRTWFEQFQVLLGSGLIGLKIIDQIRPPDAEEFTFAGQLDRHGRRDASLESSAFVEYRDRALLFQEDSPKRFAGEYHVTQPIAN